MATAAMKVRVLVIRPWTEPLASIRAALVEAGVTARIVRVDIEPALNAALLRGKFDLILFDTATKEVTLEVLEARLRDHRQCAPIIVLQSTEALDAAIKGALAGRLD